MQTVMWLRLRVESAWQTLNLHPAFAKVSPPGGKGRRNSSTIINHFFNFLQTHQHATAHSSNGERVHNISARTAAGALQFPRVHADAICGSVLCRKQRGCFQGAHTWSSSLVGHKTGKTARLGSLWQLVPPLWQGDEYSETMCAHST